MKNAIPSAVYVMQSVGGVKVGRSLNPHARRKAIEGLGVHRIDLVHSTEVREDASYIEAAAHRILKGKRLSGEWFSVTPQEAIEAIKVAIAEVEARKAALTPHLRRGHGPVPLYGEAMGTQIAIRLPDEILAAVDKIIDERHGQGGRTAVIRELLLDALAQKGKRK